jgi:hypothetical protein
MTNKTLETRTEAEQLKIGVTGYSAQKFDENTARSMLREAYDLIQSEYRNRSLVVISGLTDLGIPALAYREAVSRGWRTVGIACSKAAQYPCFNVNERIIVGNEWGQESPTFLDSFDVLIRIGGGGQARRETEEAKRRGKRVLEYELSAIK